MKRETGCAKTLTKGLWATTFTPGAAIYAIPVAALN